MPYGSQHSFSPKVRATLYLSADVLDEARNAAVHLAGYPARLTLTKLADNALRAELKRLKELYNQGKISRRATPTFKAVAQLPHEYRYRTHEPPH